MQITETGYYETRDGGLAWVYPRTPFTIAEHNNPIDGYARYGDQWEFKTWLENGKESKDQTNDKDLIRYIGKELPEEKPEEKEPDDYWYNMSNDLFKENNKLYTLIATQMLGWSEYPVKYNRSQKVFAPSQEIADTLELGRNLFKFVSEEIDRRIAEKEKPQPERVELSKLWVGWYEYDGALNRTNAYRQKRDLMRHFNTLSVKLLAITPADATSFVIGEGLE